MPVIENMPRRSDEETYRNFQSRHGLPVTGVIDKATEEHLAAAQVEWDRQVAAGEAFDEIPWPCADDSGYDVPAHYVGCPHVEWSYERIQAALVSYILSNLNGVCLGMPNVRGIKRKRGVQATCPLH